MSEQRSTDETARLRANWFCPHCGIYFLAGQMLHLDCPACHVPMTRVTLLLVEQEID